MGLTAGARTRCRACDGELAVTFADLGMQPPANGFLSPSADLEQEKRYPLRAKVCGSCKLVQVDFDVPPRELFDNYAYFSSYSDDWLAHAQHFSAMAKKRFSLNAASLVVELGSNDGYLLKEFVAAGIPVLGRLPFDPRLAECSDRGLIFVREYADTPLARQLTALAQALDLTASNQIQSELRPA